MTQLLTSKKTLWILLALVVLVLVSLSISQFLIAQEETEEEQDCKWHVLDLKGGGADTYTPVNAVQWNDCTGETYHFYRGNNSSTDPVRVRRIRTGD